MKNIHFGQARRILWNVLDSNNKHTEPIFEWIDWYLIKTINYSAFILALQQLASTNKQTNKLINKQQKGDLGACMT